MAQKKIDVIIDVVVDKANGALGSFKRSIQDADGAAGKFKAGATGAFDAVKANAGNLAMVGGAALVSFGVKSVSAFQDTALEAGKLRDSLGLTAEEASRLMEVAGDLDIPVKNLENSLGKMNVVASRSPQFFDDIGAAIARNEDGSIKVNDTFLNTVDALNKIPDAADRASAAQRIFGKDWRTISEMIGRGSEELKRNLADVADQKVIDDEEIAKARSFRDKLDELKDSVEEVQMAVGEYLVPALTDVAGAFITVKDAAGQLGDILPDMPGWVDPLVESFEMVINPLGAFSGQMEKLQNTIDPHAVGELGESITTYTPAVEDATEATEEHAEAERDRERAIKDATDAINASREAQEAANEAVLESLNSDLAYRNQVADTVATLNEYLLVQDDATTAIDEHAAAQREAEGAVMAQAEAAAQLAEDMLASTGVTITAEERTKVYRDELERMAGFMQGPARDAILQHIASLDAIPKSIYTNIGISTQAGRVGDFGPFQTGRGATGGIVTQPTMALIGEAGPEAVVPLNQMPGASPLPGGGSGGGNTYNITVSALTGPQVADQIVAKIKEFERRNGPGWRS